MEILPGYMFLSVATKFKPSFLHPPGSLTQPNRECISSHSGVHSTSSLSVLRSFWVAVELGTETGGLPGTMTGGVGRISVGTKPTPGVTGVR